MVVSLELDCASCCLCGRGKDGGKGSEEGSGQRIHHGLKVSFAVEVSLKMASNFSA
ncbi:hypothetical protein D3C80_2240060 [compost metagenome]